MTRWKAALAAVALAFSATAVACAVPPAEAEPIPVISDTFQVQGTVRWASPTAWSTVIDDAHDAIGIDYPELMLDRVRVHYEQDASRVLVCSVTPDEGFTAAGVRVGASVRLNAVDLLFYMGSSSTPVDPSKLTRAGANVWIDCEHRA